MPTTTPALAVAGRLTTFPSILCHGELISCIDGDKIRMMGGKSSKLSQFDEMIKEAGRERVIQMS